MEKQTATDRRSFLKTGALLATPVIAAAPVAALADDGSRAKLARLEDERAIEALHRSFLRQVNGGSPDAVKLNAGLRSIAGDLSRDATVELAEDGLTATARHVCKVELETEFTGNSTLEQMARFQGHGSYRHSEERVLATEYVKGKNGWQIAKARFA